MYKKYPRTPHLPWSPGATNDDKILKDTSHFDGQYIVVTEKRDGECITIYPDHIHARSLDSKDHYSRHYVKAIHASIKALIPEGWRICGENLHYTKSLHYDNLIDFFEVFSIWNEENICLSWNETVKWCQLLGLQHVPIIWSGRWDEEFIRDLKLNEEKIEGYVVRNVDAFVYDMFHKNIAKYVRKGHVQTGDHWMHQQLIPNGLAR